MLSSSVRQGSKAGRERLIIASGYLGRIDSLSLQGWRGELTENPVFREQQEAICPSSRLVPTGEKRVSRLLIVRCWRSDSVSSSHCVLSSNFRIGDNTGAKCRERTESQANRK
jgi:hypothetical protein